MFAKVRITFDVDVAITPEEEADIDAALLDTEEVVIARALSQIEEDFGSNRTEEIMGIA